MIGEAMRTLKLVLRVVRTKIVLVDLAVLTALFLFSIVLLSIANCISKAPYLVVAVEEGSTVVHGGGSLPYTGVLPASVVSSIASLLGATKVCPEVVALVSVEDTVVFLRGVEPRCSISVPLHRLGEGSDSVLAGAKISRMLRISVNDTITLKSLHTSRSIIVRVVGILSGNEVLESEIVADIRLARWLRGLVDQVSMVRIVNASACEVELLKNATPSVRDRGLIPGLLLTLFRRARAMPKGGGQATMLDHLEATEVARATSLASIAATLLLSAGALIALPTASIGAASNLLRMLAILGLGEGRVWGAVAFLKMMTFVLSFLLSLTIFAILSKGMLLEVSFLHHYWVPRIQAVDLLAYFSASTILYLCGLVRARRAVSWGEEPVEQLLL